MIAATVTARRAVTRAPAWAVGIGVYLAVRLVGIVVLAIMAGYHDVSLWGRLTAWDGRWYLAIAEHGYTEHGMMTVDSDGHAFSAAPFAFFPGLPAVVSIVAALGVSLPVAGLAVTTIAGIVAVPAILRLARHVDPRPGVGLLLVALVAAAPMSVVLNMVYTEALFIAFAVWALVGVLERRWLLAAACTVGAGCTRSSAVVLITVVVVAALGDAWRHRGGWQAIVCAAVAPLGLFGWWGTVVGSTGMTWQAIEDRGWNTRWDWGVEAFEWIRRGLLGEVHPWEVIGVAVLLAAVVLTALCVRRAPWPLLAYGAGIVALTVGSSGLPFAKPRFLFVGAFVLLIPVAVGLANRARDTRAVVVTGYVLGGVWASGYALTVWPYAI